MRYTRYLLLSVMVIGGTATTAKAEQQQADVPAPASWQASWPEFVQAYNACVRDPECHRSQFVDRQVTWEGVVDSLDLKKRTVRMDMSEPPLLDKNGKAPDVFSFVLDPSPAEILAWKNVKKGQHVRFRTNITGTDTDPEVFRRGVGKTPVFRMVLGGRDSAVFFCTGGELVQLIEGANQD